MRFSHTRGLGSIPFVERLEHRLQFSAGSLDSTFGTAGVAHLPFFGPSDNSISDLVMTASGKIVVAGDAYAGISDGVLLRYQADGQLDTSFGTGGLLRNGYAGAALLLPQPDDSLLMLPANTPTGPRILRITAAGQVDSSWTGPMPAALTGANHWLTDLGSGRTLLVTANGVASVKANGTLDSAFGVGGSGMITFSATGSTTFSPGCAVIDSSGRMLVVGDLHSSQTGSHALELRRYLSSGQLDTSFDLDGIRTLTIVPQTASYATLCQLPNGQFLLTSPTSSGGVIARFNSNGSSDTAFGTSGSTSFSGVSIFEPTVLSSGKILLGGYRNTGDVTTSTMLVARLTSAGKLDTSFDHDGIRDAFMPGTWEKYGGGVYGVRSDGRLVVGGAAEPGDGNGSATRDLFLYGTKDDGSTDATFGAGGVVETDVPEFFRQKALRSTVDAAGKLILTGYTSTESTNMMVGRLTTSGIPDSGFGSGGIAMADAGARQEISYDAVVQPDGDIVTVGRASYFSWSRAWYADDFLIARFLPNGQLDSSFGDDGVLVPDFGGTFSQLTRVALEPDGTIVAGGVYRPTKTSNQVAVLRFLTDGELDSSFGDGGVELVDAPGASDTFTDLTILADGSILVGGTTDFTVSQQTNTARYVAKLLPTDGSVDSTFGTGGFAVMQETESTEALLRLLPDAATGGVFVAGTATNSGVRFVLTKLNAGGVVDSSFGTGGTATVALAPGQTLAAVDRISGGFIAVGNAHNTTNDIVVLRVRDDGTPHPGFGIGGLVTVNLGTASESVTDVHVLPDGRAMVTGTTTEGTGNIDWSAVRLDLTPAASVQSITVDDGTAQRSNVRQVTVAFDQGVAIDPAGFQLVARNGAGAGTVLQWSNPSGDMRSWVITFSGTPIMGGSLIDGVYDLTIVASKVHAGSASGPTMSADYTFTFHRLYGDYNGDKTVNNADAFQFNKSYLKSTGVAGFIPAFDYNGDGTVNNADAFQFNKRYLQSLLY